MNGFRSRAAAGPHGSAARPDGARFPGAIGIGWLPGGVAGWSSEAARCPTARDLIWTLRTAADGYAESVEIFDEFRSDALGAGKRSVAYAMVFRAPDRTLDDTEMAKLREACIQAVHAEHGATIRA